jgi:fructose-1,6-bisphosphatase/inositol monophosphatase family enzyme
MTAIDADTTVPGVNGDNDPHDEVSLGGFDRLDAAMILFEFAAVADLAASLLAGNDDWSDSGDRDGQYSVDLAIDAQCTERLRACGLTVLSEESGLTGASSRSGARDAVVVLDPLDGSTNASLGLPWCATSMCLVVEGVPDVAMVANLRTGERFTAVRGQGAQRNGIPITVGETAPLSEAVIAVNARPPAPFAPRQYRSMGATALDIASVATPNGFDGSIDFDDDRIGVWDYLAAVLIVEEAGGVAADALGRDLVPLDHAARRRPVTAGSADLLSELLAFT